MQSEDPGVVGCLHLYIEHWGRGWVGMPRLYTYTLGFIPIEFFGDNCDIACTG